MSAQRRAHHRLVEGRCCTGDDCATRAHHRLVEEHRRWVQTVLITGGESTPWRGELQLRPRRISKAEPSSLCRRTICPPRYNVALATDRFEHALQHTIELVLLMLTGWYSNSIRQVPYLNLTL